MDKEYYEVFYNNNNIGDSNADSETLSEKTKAPSQKKEPNESHISKISIYDFLKLSIETGYWYKLGGMITNKQVVFQVARGDFDDHWSMEIKINKSVFPNRRYDAYNTYKDAIYVFGLGNSISIDLPNRVSFQQYQILLDIINQIKKFEKDYDRKIENFDADAILKEAQKKLIISYPIESDEIIVGKPIDEQIIINSLNSELKESIENCDDYLKLTNIAHRISDFYEDSFYKKSILKLIPNAEKIHEINENIRNNGMREHNNFLDLVSNIDVPSNNQFLQQLLMESKKEKTKPDKNDKVESLMSQVYDEVALKNEEDKIMDEVYANVNNNSESENVSFNQGEVKSTESKEFDKAEVNPSEAKNSESKAQQSSFGDLPRTDKTYDLQYVYGLVGSGLGLATTTLLLRKKKVNGDNFVYDVNNLTEKEKEIIDNTYQKLTGESGKHYDYAKKLSKIDNMFNLKHEKIDDYEDAKQEYEEVSLSRKLVESVSSKTSEKIDSDLDDSIDEKFFKMFGKKAKHFSDDVKQQIIEDETSRKRM